MGLIVVILVAGVGGLLPKSVETRDAVFNGLEHDKGEGARHGGHGVEDEGYFLLKR